MKLFITALLLLASNAAWAQPSQQPASEQAFSQKLLFEIQSGLNCSTSLIETQRELASVKAQLAKALEDKSKEK